MFAYSEVIPMLTRDELVTQIHEFDLDAYADLIMSGVKTAIHIQRARADENILPLGASKLGGSPDVPPDFTWPLYQNKPPRGRARREGAVPDQGLLYVFYDAEAQPWGFEQGDEEATYILYIPNEGLTLHRFMHPTAKGTYGYVEALPACSLTYFQIVTPQYLERRNEGGWGPTSWNRG